MITIGNVTPSEFPPTPAEGSGPPSKRLSGTPLQPDVGGKSTCPAGSGPPSKRLSGPRGAAPCATGLPAPATTCFITPPLTPANTNNQPAVSSRGPILARRDSHGPRPWPHTYRTMSRRGWVGFERMGSSSTALLRCTGAQMLTDRISMIPRGVGTQHKGPRPRIFVRLHNKLWRNHKSLGLWPTIRNASDGTFLRLHGDHSLVVR